MWSGAVGRYTMNSDKTQTFDIKMTFEKKTALPTVNWTTLVTFWNLITFMDNQLLFFFFLVSFLNAFGVADNYSEGI